MDKNELVKSGRLLVLKMAAEAFLLTKGKEYSENLFPRDIDVKGEILTDSDALLLHHWLMEQFKRIGVDLNQMIEATGEQVVPGKLSKFEVNELIARADDLLALLTVVGKYKEANNKE